MGENSYLKTLFLKDQIIPSKWRPVLEELPLSREASRKLPKLFPDLKLVEKYGR